MARHYWIKLWVEMLSDPKVAMLPDQQYRKFIECLLMAGFQDEGGKLPPMHEMSWLLHIQEQDIEDQLRILERAKLIHQNGDSWFVTKFSERQETPQAKSMRRLRARQKADESNSESNSYSNGYTSDSSSASASSSVNLNINKNHEIRKLFDLYESEIGTITRSIAGKLEAAWDEYDHGWFELAFSEAAGHNARSWKYVEAILKRWKADGFNSKKGKPKRGDDYDPAAHATEVYN